MTADKVILGEGAIYSTDCEETGINNNVLVVGGSGSGKTMSISEPRLLETLNSSLIVTVTKRRIVNLYKAYTGRFPVKHTSPKDVCNERKRNYHQEPVIYLYGLDYWLPLG